MSVSYEIISCDTCDYQGTSLVAAGKFVWKSGQREHWIDRSLALCQSCQGVVAIEKFPDLAMFQDARKRRSSFWRRALGRFGEDAAGKLAKEECFTVLEQVMELGRRPVCLTCGQHDVEPILLPKGGSRDASIRQLGMVHPGCGGQLTVQGSGGVRIALTRMTRIYDTEGQFVGERPGWR